MNKLVSYLESTEVVFHGALLLIILYVPHAGHLFMQLEHLDMSIYGFTVVNWLYDIALAAIIKLLILIFIINGYQRTGKAYALVSFFINAYRVSCKVPINLTPYRETCSRSHAIHAKGTMEGIFYYFTAASGRRNNPSVGLLRIMNFSFIASGKFDLNDFSDLEKFADNYPDFQTVTLNNENELKLLLELMGIDGFICHDLDNSEFTKYWNLSNSKLPELDEEQFDQFYKAWILKSERKNTMDEYGNLIFIQGLSSKWNKLAYRLIVKEGH